MNAAAAADAELLSSWGAEKMVVMVMVRVRPVPLAIANIDLDADLAQEGRRPAQLAAEPRGVGRPGLGLGGFIPRDLAQQLQQVRGGPGPLRSGSP